MKVKIYIQFERIKNIKEKNIIILLKLKEKIFSKSNWKFENQRKFLIKNYMNLSQ